MVSRMRSSVRDVVHLSQEPMTNWIDLVIDNWPTLAQWASSLGFGAVGGLVHFQLALKKQRRVLANLQRPIVVISLEGADMSHQSDLLADVGLFCVNHHRGEKAADFFRPDHRLLVIGYADNDSFHDAFERARQLRMPILVYASPGAVPDASLEKIRGYSYASLCNTDLRLISDVFAVMSTFPETKE